ncbi:hypothetical protein Srot_2710 [Segniliparus rotundus DSM 44985]|uniref:Uncharacterized protein n=1 Tax=Segniliparus rotundus (strain ATCC BAA-972 / CDC 1076 / CIP 108378 / DSM 44985 / JCM 13578) TaxID=640132 RepID=D6ZCV7_SEGRD|nr:hypothetical protein [Segniliparus rotundus]ADG99144.1 hypothetical protein Srot_2710 [Segniliparus rotundus DSM 44985]
MDSSIYGSQGGTEQPFSYAQEQSASFNQFGSTTAPAMGFAPPPSGNAAAGWKPSAPSAPSAQASGNNALMGQMPQGSTIGHQPAGVDALRGAEAAKPTTIEPHQGAGLSQAQSPQGAPTAQTHSAPPPPQPAAPPQTPPAQTLQSSSSATAPMSPGIREGTIPLHQQPATTGYQSITPQAPAPPPVQPGYQQVSRGVDPVTGSYANTQVQGNNPYPVPSRAPVFPWQDRDRQHKHLVARDSGAAWWNDAVQYFLTGWLLRGHESEQGKLAFAPLLEPAQEGQLLRKLAEGMPALEWAFVFGEHATEGPRWFWFTNQGPMLAPLRGRGVPSAAAGSLESWPGDYLHGLGAFGRARTAAEAAVLFAEGMVHGGALTQVRAVVTTEEMGSELRDRALGVNTHAQAASGEGHLDNTVVLDLRTAREQVPGFADGKPVASALRLTHPLASANRGLYLRLERLASLWADRGEIAPAGLPIPGWRMAGLAHLASHWVLMALGQASGNWSGERSGWVPVMSEIREALSSTEPWFPPNPDLSSHLAAFDHTAQSFAVMTLRDSKAWLIGDLSNVQDQNMLFAMRDSLADPQQRGEQLRSLAAGSFDSAWRVVLAWEATRLATAHIWREGGPDGNMQWLYDLGYLMHKMYNADLCSRTAKYDANGALERFEAWAQSFDQYNPKPMPNLV